MVSKNACTVLSTASRSALAGLRVRRSRGIKQDCDDHKKAHRRSIAHTEVRSIVPELLPPLAIASSPASASCSSASTPASARRRPAITSPVSRTASGRCCSNQGWSPSASRSRTTIGCRSLATASPTSCRGRRPASTPSCRRSTSPGRLKLRRKILRFKPAIVAMVGVTVYRAMFPGAQRAGNARTCSRSGSATPKCSCCRTRAAATPTSLTRRCSRRSAC